MIRPRFLATCIGVAALISSFTVSANTYGKASIEQLKALAARSDIIAMSILGERYDMGDGVAQNKPAAVQWYTKAAERGHVKSQYNLALMYDNGDGVAENNRLALIWYRFAADQGHTAAQANVGAMYDQGEGTPEDNAEAIKWFKKAAKQGDAKAQYNLGLMYFKGEGTQPDMAEAIKWYTKAAKQGDQDALSALNQLSTAGMSLTASSPVETKTQSIPERAESTEPVAKAAKSTKEEVGITRKAVVFDPPSNIRTKPEGKHVLCTIESNKTIKVSGSGEWLATNACGEKGYIHRKQIRIKD